MIIKISCKEIDSTQVVGKSNGWEKDVNKVYKLTDLSNYIRYEFKNLNEDIKDLCSKITYTSTKPVQLRLQYIARSSYELIEGLNILSGTNQNVEFCIRDFIYGLDENFSLIYSVKTYNEKVTDVDLKDVKIEHNTKSVGETQQSNEKLINSFDNAGFWDWAVNKNQWKTLPSKFDFTQRTGTPNFYSIDAQGTLEITLIDI